MSDTHNPHDYFHDPLLLQAGLNMQTVLDIDCLPTPAQAALAAAAAGLEGGRQLLLFGNGGRDFWTALGQFQASSAHPVDEFSQRVVQQFMAAALPDVRYRILYPGPSVVPLQQLGELAGWHHPSPMMVGINDVFGLWYAYRVLVMADSRLQPAAPVAAPSPCGACVDKPCVRACPAGALAQGTLELARCLDQRLAAASSCRQTCLARTACPVASEHRYTDAQIHYHYEYSLGYISTGRFGSSSGLD